MRLCATLLIACALPLGAAALAESPAHARRPDTNDPRPPKIVHSPPPAVSLDRGVADTRLRSAAAPDTTWLGYWTFDNGPGSCTPEGWTVRDMTAQTVFTHVDDFTGLGGGDSGRLVPLDGGQSLWCGARPSATDDELCLYAALPGYGNTWDQRFTTVSCLSVTGDVTIDYLFAWDSEPGYDSTALEYDRCDDDWTRVEGGIPAWDGVGSGAYSTVIPDASLGDAMRLRFRFTSDGAYSDEDGSFPTDGAFILDSLTVSDAGGVVLPTEDFEGEAIGATVTLSGNWAAGTRPGYGDFSGLFPGTEVLQEDPCVSNLSCFWAFFNGSTYDYSCGGHPEQAVVPYGNERGQYIANEVWSPFVPITGSGSQFEIGFDAYGVPRDPLVAFVWHVRTKEGTCPTEWTDRNFLYLGEQPHRWEKDVFPVGDLVPSGATEIQLALGVFDACHIYCGTFGSGQCHTQGPLLDNAWIRRIDTNGPVWVVDDVYLFHDNFPSDGSTTGTVRADITLDVSAPSNPGVIPGDSAVVTLVDDGAGLATDPHTGFGPAAYVYVNVQPPQPGKAGAALSSDSFRWPVVDSLMHGGDIWYAVRVDTVFNLYRDPYFVRSDAFCVDLNDSLFTPGDEVRFFFGASNTIGETTYWSRFTGTTNDITAVLEDPMEFSCLPSPGADILYVDNFDGLGAQPFFDTAFELLGISGAVDRYDIRAPLNSFENGPASRVTDPLVQLAGHYRVIVWNSGSKDVSTLKDAPATGNDDKRDDAALLKVFLDNLEQPGGLYLSGDNLASDLKTLTNAGAVDLRGVYMSFNVVDNDHSGQGLGISPLVVGADGGAFDHITGPDTLIAYGGCPYESAFDVLQPAGASTLQASYQGSPGAVLGQKTMNPLATEVGVALSGFSFHSIRDAHTAEYPARVEHLYDILAWLGMATASPTGAESPALVNTLEQNYPNPFNPATTIAFTVRERAPVTLRIYNVAGQRVRTLVNDDRRPGVVHTVEWNGRNDAGQSVASGVYFYRLVTKDYVKTKKMVLLK